MLRRGTRTWRGSVVPGWNFYDDNADTSDINNHGTAVAGTAAAASNNTIGVASVAWDCKIMPLRVSGPYGFADSYDITAALVRAADDGARIANISFGGVTNNPVVTTGAEYFQSKAKGVVTVAAGNSGTFDDSHSDNPYVLNISATDRDDVITTWSARGNTIDLSAPGVGIMTTTPDGNYGGAGGTSFATPVVAGVGALVLSVNGRLSGEEVQEIIKGSADDLGPRRWDPEYGWGRVNAARAVSMALGYESTPDETPPTVAIVDPASGAVLSGLSVVVATASDDTSVSQVDLYDDDVLISSDTVPPHQWTIDTTGMPDGVHLLRAIAHDAAGNAGMSASVQVTVDNSVPCQCPPDCSEPAANEIPGESCTDGSDNDCDGAVDCDDPDCDSDAACFVPGCGNGACEADEDMCSCPQDCGSAPSVEVSCENGVDDDCDGAVDCADNDCASDAACNVEPCGDGLCDSTNGEDGCTCPEDCGAPPSTERKCTDGMDDDCDGLADGDDPDCITTSGCGNGVCEGDGEDCFTCPEDCGCRGSGCRACCGNGVCKGPGEDKNTCPVDCAR